MGQLSLSCESKNQSNEEINELINKICKNATFEQYTTLMKYLFSNDLYSFNEFLEDAFSTTEKTMKKNFQETMKYLINKIYREESEEIIRAISCIYGAFLGDSMGAYTEFLEPSKNNYLKIFDGKGLYGEEKGSITDDSEMAICLSYGIMTNQNINEISPSHNYYFYGCWYNSHPVDIGYTTRKALSFFSFDSYDPEVVDFNTVYAKYKNTNLKSKANGFMMRLSTFIVWFYFTYRDFIINLFKNEGYIDSELLLRLYKTARIEAKKDNICTHPNSELNAASAFYTIMGISAIYGLTNEQLLKLLNKLIILVRELDCEDDKYISNITDKYIKEFTNSNEDPYNIFGTGNEGVYKSMGWYINAYKLTLYYLIKLNNYNNDTNSSAFRKIMNEVNNFGGDTDTNGAIIGAIIGPIFTYKNFDEDFDLMIKAYPPNRLAFSPPLMYFYICYLKYCSNLKEKKSEKYLVLKIFLSCFYDSSHTFFNKYSLD